MRRKNTARKRALVAFGGFMLLAAIVAFLIIRNAHQPRTPALPEPPLKELADQHGVEVGNFAILTRINEKPYHDILTSQFDFVLADNTPNWYFTDGGLRPSATTYNFKQMDEVMKFARENNMPVEAHHFVWGEEKWLPEWLKKGNYDKAQLLKLIQDHIQTVGGKYRGQIRQWSVVNEAFTRGENLYGLHDWWADNTGDKEYIDKAFVWARQADPNAVLILNDFHNESVNTVSNAMYDYVKDAKSRGIPIDAIGMQMHIDGSHPPTKDEVVKNMKRFGDLGVKVYVTELDVNMNDVPASPEAKDNIQGKIYYEMARACIESRVCNSFALLGITDNETWYSHMGLSDPRPLPFDKKYRPKPAFYGMRDAFAQP